MKKLMNFIEWASQYNKAIVPTVVAVILWGLNHFGVTPQMTVEQAVTLLVGLITAFVWAIPNRTR